MRTWQAIVPFRVQEVKNYFSEYKGFAGAVWLPCFFEFMDLFIAVLMALLAGLGLWLLYREGLLRSRTSWLLASALMLLALGARLAVFDYETLDYQNFLAHWCAFFRENGGFKALRWQVGNYNIPYLYLLAFFSYLPTRDLYLIKYVSVLFDVLLAWAVLRLVKHATVNPVRRFASFFAVLFLPTVYLNGAVWGQCDSIYVALLLLGIALALEDRPRSSMVMAALAFGFKLQAVFVLPIYAVLWMKGKFKTRHLLLFPLTYVLLVLPAVIAGRPFLDTITLYFSQTGSIGSGLNYNSPSVFAFFWRIPEKDQALASAFGIGAAFLFLLNMLGVAWINRHKLNDQAILGMTLLFAIGIPFLLPHMHDRYFYAADILSLVIAFAYPLFFPAALLVQFASLLGYHAYLKMRYLLYMDRGSIALIAAFAFALACFIQGVTAASKKKR